MMEATIGSTIKGYEVKERIGTGGFGAVYRAYQTTVGREVVIKCILPSLANRPEFIRRFETEAQIIARLEHLHIVPLYDYWRDPEGAYLVMRYLRGGSLRDALVNGPYDLEAAAKLVDQICGGLVAAHRRTVIHRDLKPANILLDEDGNAYLADFGIAKDLTLMGSSVTEPDQLIGSPDYLAPEQARAEAVTPQTDIYSLGVVLYEMLTGQHPYPGLSAVERLFKHLNEPIPLITTLESRVADDVNAVIQRATAKNPVHRFEDILDFAVAFREAAALSVTHAGDRLVELLTPREQEVLKMLIEGKSNREIAHALVVELSTVKWHITQIYQKLNVRSRVQAIVRARELNLIVQDRTPDTSITFSVLPEPKNPYKGLRAFEAADEQDFCGREKLTKKLLKRLEEKDHLARFLAVVGPSGSGKSSVVKAGLIPALWRGEMPGSEKWFIVEMVPGARPIDELEIALLRIASNQSLDLRTQLSRDEHGLIRAAQLLLPDDGSDLLLLVDQFEEVFTLVEKEEDRQHFLDLIYRAVTEPRSRVRVVLTMRADFYDRPLHYEDFGELVRSRMETVLPLSAEEIERAISQPAERVGISFEEGLVTSIIADVHYQPGGLPLLQYALTELFESRHGRMLTHEAYQQIGRAVGALAKRAEDLYSELSADGKEAVRQMFMRLVTPGDGTEDVRRRGTGAELLSIAADPDLMDEVIDTFASYRLLSLDHDPASREPTVEVAHEALLREWERLRNWLNENRQEIRLQRQLSTLAAEWQTAGRDVSYLSSGVRLEQFATWSNETNLTLTPIERDYISESLADRERQNRTKIEQQLREARLELRSRRVLQGLVAVSILAALISGGLAWWANTERGRATTAEREAKRQASIGLAALSDTAREAGNQDLGTLLALEAVEFYPFTTQAAGALSDSVAAYRPVTRLDSRVNNIAYTAAWSPDGTRVAAGTLYHLIIWDAISGEKLIDADSHTPLCEGEFPGIAHVAWSPDGTRIATAAWGLAGCGVIVQDAASGDNEWVLPNPEILILNVSWSPDGTTIVTGADDGTLTLWDVETHEARGTLIGHTARINDIEWSADGSRIATASADGVIRLWDANTLREDQVLSGHVGAVLGIDWSPDGSQLLSGGSDGLPRIWDTTTGEPILVLRGHTREVVAVDWSPDGRLLATNSDIAKVWDARTGGFLFELTTVAQPYIGFSPDGQRLMVPSGEHNITHLWDMSMSTPHFISDSAWLEWADWSPDGKLVATSENNAVGLRLWDAQSGELLQVFANMDNYNRWASWSPDGTRLVQPFLPADQSVNSFRVWDVTSGEALMDIPLPTTLLPLWADWSPDGTKILGITHIVAGDSTNSILIFDAETGAELNRIETHDNCSSISWSRWSPDGSRIVTGCFPIGENEVWPARVWDAATGDLLLTLESDHGWPLAVEWSPDGRRILVTRELSVAQLWDAESGALLNTYTGHSGRAWRGLWSPDGTMVATADSNGLVKVWNPDTLEELTSFSVSGNIQWIDWSPDGQYIMVSGYGMREPVIKRVWQSTTDLVDFAKACCVTRILMPEERKQFGLPERPGAEVPSTSQPSTSQVPVALTLTFSLGSSTLALIGVRRLRSQR